MKTLCQLFAQYGTTDKNTDHTYGPVYDELFPPFRECEGVFLELGIGANCGALKAWRDYFSRMFIVGVDCDPLKRFGDTRIECHWADLNDAADLVKRLTPYLFPDSVNIIVDDGPHVAHQQITCMSALWPFLKSGGLYVIEDASEFAEGWYEDTKANRWLPKLRMLYDARERTKRHDDVLYVFQKD